MDIESRLAECLSRLPEGVSVEYEIIQGVVNWRITEKPVALRKLRLSGPQLPI